MYLTRTFAAALALGALVATGAMGCHTIKGMGQDLEHGGKAIENAVDKSMSK